MDLIEVTSHEQWLECRSNDVTSTECAALFGLSPYMTAFELWHRKKNKEIVLIEQNERMKWGNRLESAIAYGVAEDQGWLVEPFKDYGRMPELKAGSSFDFKITHPEMGLLEIKNVDSLQFKEKWVIEDGVVVEAPPHIEVQCQHQLLVTGFKVLYIAALVGGNTVAVLKRTPDEKIQNAIRFKIEWFWNSIEKNNPPEPDFEKDAKFITELYNSAEPGKLMVAQEGGVIETLAADYKELSEKARDVSAKRDAVKAQLLMEMGDAEKVTGKAFTISAGLIGPAEVSYERKGYRSFRVHYKKVKEE